MSAHKARKPPVVPAAPGPHALRRRPKSMVVAAPGDSVLAQGQQRDFSYPVRAGIVEKLLRPA